MAKKRAVKAAVKSTAGAKRHPPAMYPDPARIEIKTPLKIVAFDPKTRTITIEGPTPPELLAAAEAHRHRLNLNGRIKQYAASCLAQIEPHWGERPKHISPAKWKNREQRIRAMAELPETAPADAHDALKALQTLNLLADELVEADDWPDSIDRALCYAIDLGQLLQRGQAQRDYGETVDTGRRNAKATAGATQANALQAVDRSEAAHAEFNRRMTTVKGKRRKTDTLRRMSEVMDDDGTTPQWGSIATLKRWSRGWNGRTPSE